jgi:hypothetical protein
MRRLSFDTGHINQISKQNIGKSCWVNRESVTAAVPHGGDRFMNSAVSKQRSSDWHKVNFSFHCKIHYRDPVTRPERGRGRRINACHRTKGFYII